MHTFLAASRLARDAARQSNRDVYVLADALGGWKLRHEDGSIPSLVLEHLENLDEEYREAHSGPPDETCLPVHRPDRHNPNNAQPLF